MSESVNFTVTAAASSTVTVSPHRLSVNDPLAPSVQLRRLYRDRAIRPNHDSVDPLLRLVQFLFAMLFQLCTAFIGLYRIVELDLTTFESAHDAFQFGERVLETHRGDIGQRRFVHQALGQFNLRRTLARGHARRRSPRSRPDHTRPQASRPPVR